MEVVKHAKSILDGMVLNASAVLDFSSLLVHANNAAQTQDTPKVNVFVISAFSVTVPYVQLAIQVAVHAQVSFHQIA